MWGLYMLGLLGRVKNRTWIKFVKMLDVCFIPLLDLKVGGAWSSQVSVRVKSHVLQLRLRKVLLIPCFLFRD